jgi:hypothetical protein
MLVSQAEMFWVGLVHGLLQVEPLKQPPNDNYPPEVYPASYYERVLRLAELCKIGERPTLNTCLEDAPGADPAAIRWTRLKDRTPADSLEVREAMNGLYEATHSINEQCSGIDSLEQAKRRFEELTAKEAVFSGYDPATPALLYSICADGTIRVTGRARPIPQGLLHIVLLLLAKHVAFPPIAHMALAATDQHDTLCDAWISDIPGLFEPVGTTDAAAAMAAVDRDLIGTAHNDDAFQLGQTLGVVLESLNQIALWLSEELVAIQGAQLSTRAHDFIPDQRTSHPEACGETSDADAEGIWDVQKPEDDQFSQNTYQSSSGDIANTWEDHAASLFKRACLQIALGIEIPQIDSPTRPYLRTIKTKLEAAIPRATNFRSDALVDMLTRSSALVSAILNESRTAQTTTKADTLDVMFGNREKLSGLGPELEGVLLTVFTELKLCEILNLETIGGLTPAALEGWRTLAINGRDTVREGMAMMANGVPPYVVINALQPMLESIVKRLADRNGIRHQGMDLRELLKEIMSRAVVKGDADLQRLASVGMAMRRPRNNAVHEDDREYDKHDAAFFLNGIVILLRGLM